MTEKGPRKNSLEINFRLSTEIKQKHTQAYKDLFSNCYFGWNIFFVTKTNIFSNVNTQTCKKKSQNRAAKYIKLELWEMFVFLCRKQTKQKGSRTKKQIQTREASNVIFKGQIAILKHLLKNSQHK